eukprot:SAG11_NODE_1353_length_5128_cov_3.658183_3_plen_64_part_00
MSGGQQFIILGTTVITVLWDLNYAVVIFTVIYQVRMHTQPIYYVSDARMDARCVAVAVSSGCH